MKNRKQKIITFYDSGSKVQILKRSKLDFNEWGLTDIDDEHIKRFINEKLTEAFDILFSEDMGNGKPGLSASLPHYYYPDSDGWGGKPVKYPLTIDVEISTGDLVDDPNVVFRYRLDELIKSCMQNLTDANDGSYLSEMRSIQVELHRLADSMENELKRIENVADELDRKDKSLDASDAHE